MNGQVNGSGGSRRALRIPRWLIVAVATLALVIVAAVFALKLIFSPEKLRAMVVPRLEAAVGRDVELSAVRLKIFPRIAIRLEDLAIANPPDFDPGPAVRLDALDLEVRLLPLLRRQVELSRVRLLRPDIRYEVLADGTSNFAGLGPEGADTVRPGDEPSGKPGDPEARDAPGDAAGGASRGARLGTGLLVTDLTLEDGSVRYTNHGNGPGARLAVGARLNTDRAEGGGRSLVGGGEFDVRSIVALIPGLGPDSVALPDLDVVYRLFVDFDADSAVLTELGVTVGRIDLAGSAAVRGLGPGPHVELALESEDLDIAHLMASLPPALRPMNIAAAGRARLSLEVAGPLGEEGAPALDGTVRLADMSATYGEHGEVLRDGIAVVHFDRDTLAIPSFAGEVLGRRIEADLRVAELEAPVVAGRVSGEVDLARLARLRENGPPLSGAARLDVGLHVPLRDRGSLQLDGPVRLENVEYRSEALAVPARIPSGTVRLTGRGVRADSIPVRLGGSDLTLWLSSDGLLAAAIELAARDSTDEEIGPAAAPHVQFRVTSRQLDVGEIMGRDTSAVGYSDLLTAHLAGRSVGGRAPGEVAAERYRLPPLPPITAEGGVRIEHLRNPPTLARDVAFDVTLKDGVLALANLRGNAYGGRFGGRLSVDLSRGQPPFPLSYELDLEEAEATAFLTRWTRLGRALSGKVNFRVAGDASLDETLLPRPDAVNARGRALFSEGRFVEFGLTRALRDRFKLEADRLTNFQQLGGSFAIEKGAFLVDDWRLASRDVEAGIAGSAGLGGGLDLELTMVLPLSALERAGLIRLSGGGLLGDVITRIAGRDKTIELAVGIGGTISEPSIEVDREALLSALEKSLEGVSKDLIRRLIRLPN